MNFNPIAWRRFRLFWLQPSLRNYLVFLLLLATVPMALVMSYLLINSLEQEEERRQKLLYEAASLLASAVERELNASVDALNTLALSESLHQGELRQFEQALHSAGRLRGGWSGAFLIDLDGRVLFDTAHPNRNGTKLAQFPELGGMGKQLAPQVSNLVIDGSTNQYSSVISVPVSINGTQRYALGAWLPVTVWQSLIERGVEPTLGVGMLYDRDRRIIARTPSATNFLGQTLQGAAPANGTQGSGRVSLLEGGDGYASWRSVPASDWGVKVVIPARVVDGTQRRTAILAITTVAASLLLGVSLALFAARRVTNTLQQLADRGDIDTGKPAGVREITQLHDALRAARQRDEFAHHALQNKADEFETLFHSTPIGLAFTLDTACSEVIHNQAMTDLFGSFAEASKNGRRMLRDGVDVVSDEWPVCLAARSGKAVPTTQIDLVRPGQPTRSVIASAAPLRDAEGRPRGAVAAMVDITEQMQAEARLQRSDTRLRQSERLVELAQRAGAVGFFQYQFEADLLTWTPGQAKLFGMETNHFESSLADLLARMDCQDRGDIEMSLRRAFAAQKESETLDYRVSQANGAERWLSTHLSVSYSPDGRPQQMLGVTVDVTDRKQAEQAKQALIEQEQVARGKAEAANRAKDEFLAMLGHELRNPLSAISFAVGVLSRNPTPEMSASACEIVDRQTRHLSQKVAEMLSMTSAMSGLAPPARQTLDLAALVQRVIAKLLQSGEAAAHRLSMDLAEVWVEVDPDHIEQVIGQLVGNALKYTPAGSEVNLQVKRDGDEALLVVRDNGPGISQELLPHVFELFVQGERPLDRQAGGLGIGLTLVKRLVEKHGGTVAAKSSSAGSLFEVRLPAAPAHDAVAKEWMRRTHAQYNVLLVEDNLDALKSLHDLLSLDGHHVSAAVDGEAGLQALLEQHPDVAIVDIGLPKLDGLQLAKRARAGGYAGRMIALTGYGQEQDVKRSLKAGFDAHLVKPLQPEQLRQEISRV
jgi:PAS domain S-box-containing protein